MIYIRQMLIKSLIAFLFLALNCLTVFSQVENNQFDTKGERHGVWKGFYKESKRPRYEGNFNHGKETGVFKYFDDTKAGTVIATRNFSKGDGSCYAIFYNQKGNKVSEGLLVNKLPHGEWKYFHFESDQLMSLENYKQGKLNGVKKVFYKDGSLAEVSNYVNGKKQGLYKKYAENETILEEINYKGGKLDGPALYYDGKGNINVKGQFKNDRKWGYWETYENGKLVSKEKISRETRKTFTLEKNKEGKMAPTELKPKNEK
ncbi:toxin-antitoxin system YwqK family antitoxin [Flavobacterium jejuense]|uniref:toxin-antitoxin system YwqK family antitoxin n=1 Tax=Flavobacterium jejuense TaxID=1544455 RepID=UPI001AA09D9F|nr:toxin-antitoxin system YwqK family antitoxin [Flavobacterium jejuense]